MYIFYAQETKTQGLEKRRQKNLTNLQFYKGTKKKNLLQFLIKSHNKYWN